MNDRIQEIRERLEAASPGPWTIYEYSDYRGYEVHKYPIGYKSAITGWGKVLQTKEDASLIANAPTDISYLLSEVERLQTALEFYADEKTYETNVVDQWGPVTKIDFDSGERARTNLSHLKG
ncbi:hypothetical protein [Paenibacillus vini]|uniref:Uncharacterized protein n=1 Tax=Paenibacillus vini TaxID=1476024 RepID=A0ABQ4MIW4_9BACL|nr:hypothetical protein [Paenibacillus vini]GIP55928.1 hypothetical protein J42TS3_49630 [Paenibacillus vini]